MTKVFINGEFVNEEDAKVSYEDRGYVFGDGIYEYIRAYDGKLFTVKEHFERFLRSAEEIGLDLNYTIEELIELVRRLLKENNVVNGGIYIQDRPYEELEQGVYAITTEDIRWLRCDIKSLNLLGNVLAKEYAVKYNAAEAIQHRGDIVTEGASSNVYAIKDGVIYTHPVNNFILNGITRRVIKWIAEDEQIPFKEETFTVEFLKSADEVIISSTSAEVMPITKIDGENVQDGQVGTITRQLQQGFEKYIQSHSI